jgi:hypothetical protein
LRTKYSLQQAVTLLTALMPTGSTANYIPMVFGVIGTQVLVSKTQETIQCHYHMMTTSIQIVMCTMHGQARLHNHLTHLYAQQSFF